MASKRDLAKLGKSYREAHKGFLPDRTRRSGRKQKRKALEALGDGDGWLSRLAMAGDRFEFYTIHLVALGLEHLEHEKNLYDHAAVQSIKKAVLRIMPSKFWARLEAGSEVRRLHVHVLGHEAPQVAHNAQEVQSLEKIALYVNKCQVPGDDLSAGIFVEAQLMARREKRNLPRTSFWRGIPRS